ncbi:hypothetical protein MTP99_003244 [Tenebrio molitor]|uniref:lysosomal acid lipase/cholesteryl ester hydrolase-like n=1 Tax=Tenebrio molitor TaxID=7067 RepID=UPI0027098016|nr:hypothetical protein MTP99_003244 [Tenebrio molitor]
MVFKIASHLLLVLLSFIFVPFNSNNSCSNYLSYLFISFSSDCYHNPDVNDNITNIIQRHTNSSETHQVQTEDGYILNLFRIRRENPRGVIFFQHGLFTDARAWVSQYNDSVAFLFWRAGYDVWLGNNRGNLYGKKHVTWKPSDGEFWNYSLLEIGYYDLDASVEYIKSTTSEGKIIYVGVSMGATTGLIYASMRPEASSQSVQIMISIAPCTHFKYADGILKYIVPLSDIMQRYNKYTGIYTLLRNDNLFMKSFRLFHRIFPFKKYLVYLLSFFFGWTPDEMDPNYANLMVSHFGSETSIKIIDHFYQMYYQHRFQAYDYGEVKNMEVYGSKRPFLFPLKKIKLPVYIIYSDSDYLSYYKDNELVYNDLSEEVTIYGKLAVKGLNHVDYLYSKHRNQKLFNKILRLLDSL